MYEKIRHSLDNICLDPDEKTELWERILMESRNQETEEYMTKPKKIYKIALIAAVAAVLLTGTALAANLLGLSTVIIPDGEVEHPVTGEELAAVSYTMPMEGPEEFLDWAARCTALTEALDARMEELFPEDVRPYLFTPDENVFGVANGDGTHTYTNLDNGETVTMTDEEAEAYAERCRIFSEEWDSARQSVLEEFALEYGLTVRDDEEVHITPGTGGGAACDFMNHLASSVCSGDLFAGDISSFDKFYCFDGGSFGASYGIEAPSGSGVDTYIRFTPMNEYVTGFEVGYYLTGVDDYQSRSYVTKDGTELVVCQNEQQAMVYGYLDVGYCVLEIHSDDGVLGEEDVNYALDFLNFSVIGK